VLFDREEKDDHYFELRLLPGQYESLLRFLEQKKRLTTRSLEEITNAVKSARKYDLKPAEMLWEEWEQRAEKRGESLADLVWDAPWK
jgi:hypothetical protein